MRLSMKVLIIALATIISFYVLFSFENTKNDFKIKIGTTKLKTKYILHWTDFFGDKNFALGKETFNATDLESIECQSTNCIITCKKDFLPNVEDYDAIIFHVDSTPWFQKGPSPKSRHPRQFYILAGLEPPHRTSLGHPKDFNFFNLTMSYRLDSDILWTYGETRNLFTHDLIAPMSEPKWEDPDLQFSNDEFLKIMKNKTKTAAWFVSDCNQQSRRDELVKNLQQLGVEIDVYGKCGNLSCPNTSENYCLQMLNTTYKFYFAFENSLCIDYLTEKSFKVMNLFVIPVIFTGANLTRFLPPNSYIDVNSFKKTENLAEYLKFIANNPAEMVKFFYWKEIYRIDQYCSEAARRPCNLCIAMNDPKIIENTKSYENPGYWAKTNTCSPARIQI